MHYVTRAPTCTAALSLTSCTVGANQCTSDTYMSQLDRKCHKISFVLDEIGKISVHRMTFHGDIRGSLWVTWQQDGGQDEYLGAIMLVVIDGLVETDCQLFVVAENFTLPRVALVILHSQTTPTLLATPTSPPTRHRNNITTCALN